MCFAHSGTTRVNHNRWNRDLPAALTVQPGEEVQLLCRDALDIGDQARTLTPDGSISPALGLFGTLRPDALAGFAPYTEASQLSDPYPGRVATAIPEDQPYGTGAPYVQLFHFDRGQSSGFATFVGADTGKRARIPVAPFMGILGNAPMRKGMYRTFPPSVSGSR